MPMCRKPCKGLEKKVLWKLQILEYDLYFFADRETSCQVLTSSRVPAFQFRAYVRPDAS